MACLVDALESLISSNLLDDSEYKDTKRHAMFFHATNHPEAYRNRKNPKGSGPEKHWYRNADRSEVWKILRRAGSLKTLISII